MELVKDEGKASVKRRSKAVVKDEVKAIIEDDIKADVFKTESEGEVKTDVVVKGENEGGVKAEVKAEVSIERKIEHEEERPGQFIRKIFKCQRSGTARVNKDAVKGGKSNKPRKRKAGMKIGCKATYSYSVEARPNRSHAFRVVYEVEHNHVFGSLADLGTRQLSEMVKSTIRTLIIQGSTIQM